LSGLQADCWICQSLSKDPHLVYYESKTSLAKLNPDQLFRGYTFLTLKHHSEHLHLLPARVQKKFLDDMLHIATGLAKALNPDRLNYELLGNAQAHLHWHIVPRYTNDPMWGRPIWAGSRPRKRLTSEDYEQLKTSIQAALNRQNRKPTKSLHYLK
jgi:diadenosine tetraphosphate (Ap4A) HIT family hydrolase